MLYNGVFGCHGNTCYVIFIGAILYMLYSIGQSMCVPILRSIGTKLTKLENMQISRFIWFIWRHVTQKRYVMRHGDCDTSDRYFDKEHFETNQKSLRLPVQKLWLKWWFSCFRWPWPWPLTYVLLFVTRTAHDILEYTCEVSLESVQ